MIGIVLVTHGRLAQEFISAMEHMVGPQTHLRAVCIGPEDDIERRQREIAAAVKSVDLGKGVVTRTMPIMSVSVCGAELSNPATGGKP